MVWNADKYSVNSVEFFEDGSDSISRLTADDMRKHKEAVDVDELTTILGAIYQCRRGSNTLFYNRYISQSVVDELKRRGFTVKNGDYKSYASISW